MNTQICGIPASVVDAVRLVWPRYTAQIVGNILGWSHRTVGNRLQKRLARDDWDAMVKLMARSEPLERHVLAMVRVEREKTLHAATDGARGGMAAGQRRAGGLDVARGLAVPGHGAGCAGAAGATAGVSAGAPR